MINRNLFTGLVNNENDVTELLVNLMHIYEDFRKASLKKLLVGLIGENTIDDVVGGIVAGNISTQEYLKDSGIPDIVIKNTGCHFFIENKIHVGTPLTRHQVGDYASILDSESQNKGLVFLIPKEYKHLEEIEQIKNSFKRCSVFIVFWDDFLYRVKNVVECSVYKAALDRMKCIIDNAVFVDTRFTLSELNRWKNENLYKILCDIDNSLKTIKNDYSNFYEEQCNQYGIGFYYWDDTGKKCFTGYSPNVQDSKYLLSTATFSKSIIDEGYSEWSDWDNGYWTYQQTSTACSASLDDVREIYTFADKIVQLCKAFINCNTSLSFCCEQKNHEGIGCYFNLSEEASSRIAKYFIGFDPSKCYLYLSIRSNKQIAEGDMIDKKVWWHPSYMNIDCLSGDDLVVQQKKFNYSALDALKTVNLDIKKDGKGV